MAFESTGDISFQRRRVAKSSDDTRIISPSRVRGSLIVKVEYFLSENCLQKLMSAAPIRCLQEKLFLRLFNFTLNIVIDNRYGSSKITIPLT